uniref:Uncharacterized protein n=1 Tax=Aegilops tauschii subsp. strangulata TaxID=200361 RepID=A0A453LEX9_AEGTS
MKQALGEQVPHGYCSIQRRHGQGFWRAKVVIIDPGLYMDKVDVLWIPQCRSMPTSFKLFTGNKSGHCFLS